MTIDQIQTNLRAVLIAIPALAAVEAHVLIDDCAQEKVMEDSLTSEGLSILIMPPQCINVRSQGRGAASLDYATTIWVRTNPKIQVANVAKWNPLALEKLIIPAVLNYGQPPNHFQIPDGLEPETDFSDSGNNSRLIRFYTSVIST